MPREVDGQRHATDIFYRLVGLDYLGRMYMNEPDMFYPLSYKIIVESIEDEATNPTYRYSAYYHVQNISGRDIGEGEEDFHLFYFKMNLDAVGTIKGSRSVLPLMGESPDNRPRLPRVKDEVFVVNEEALSSQQIKYIIAVGRTQALPGGKRE